MARKARPKTEPAPAATRPEHQTFTLQLTLGELRAVKAALSRTSGLTAPGKVLTGQAEIKVDALLPEK